MLGSVFFGILRKNRFLFLVRTCLKTMRFVKITRRRRTRPTSNWKTPYSSKSTHQTSIRKDAVHVKRVTALASHQTKITFPVFSGAFPLWLEPSSAAPRWCRAYDGACTARGYPCITPGCACSRVTDRRRKQSPATGNFPKVIIT